MQQSKMESLIEAVVNTVIGYWINFVANALILPMYGFVPTFWQNVSMGLLFTGISVARSYALRRFFNRGLHKAAVKLVSWFR